MALSHAKRRIRLILEMVEKRIALSAGVPANTIAVVPGVVSSPGTVAEAPVPVSARNLGGRQSIIISESVKPAAGSGLAPAVAGARGANGKALPVRTGMPYIAGRHGSALAYIRVSKATTVKAGVTGQHGSTGKFQLNATLPGDITGSGKVTLADEQAFTKAYLTVRGDALYNPAADANHNGQIGQDDGRYLLRNFTPLTPNIPLNVALTLSPQQLAKGPTPVHSGAATYLQTVTIHGKTTPGALIFSDDPSADYSFRGPALSTDAEGNFSIEVKLKNGINNYTFLVIDPFGQQKIAALPIRWLGFNPSK